MIDPMPKVKLTPEFKTAISYLSSTEKDKLLYRLLAKEPLLVEQLIVKLLEGNASTEDRREKMANKIKSECADYELYSPGYLLMLVRDLSSQITFHCRATKDKMGEVELNLLLLNTIIEEFGEELNSFSYAKNRTLIKYILQRTIKLLGLMPKIHEDYWIELEADFKKLGLNFGDYPHLMHSAIHIGLDANWLINQEFFKDLTEQKAYIKSL
jgi:hypothetical protein